MIHFSKFSFVDLVIQNNCLFSFRKQLGGREGEQRDKCKPLQTPALSSNYFLSVSAFGKRKIQTKD